MIEYFASNLWQAWSIVALLCLILELTSGDFFFCCFAIGAVAGAVVAPFSTLWVQLGVFAIVSVASLFWVRPVALRCLHKGQKERPSNYEAIVGRRGRVTTTIPVGDYGRVAIDGDDWKACSTATEELPVGTAVRVTALDSIIITVEKDS